MRTWTEAIKLTDKKKEARERYQNISEEEKDKSRQYARAQYRNLCEEEKGKKRQYGRELLENEKQRLVEYINNYSVIQK